MNIGIYVNHLARKAFNATAISIMGYQFYKAFSNMGHKTLIIANKNINEMDENIDFISLSGKLNGELFYAKRLKEIAKLYNLDVIYSFMKAQNTILSISKALGNRVKAIGNVQNNDAFLCYGKAYYLPYLMKKVIDNLDGLIVPSVAIKEDLRKTYFIKDKVNVIPNPIDIEDIIDKSKEEVELPTGFNVINVARLIPQKAQYILIKAMKELYSYKDINLLIVGDGELKNDLISLAKDLGVSDRVIFYGYQYNPYKYMVRSDVFVLSSIYEGFGNVVIEAMALGKPVILTKTQGGHIEISSSKYAIECEFNEKALAKAILKLYEDKELYIKYSNLSKERSKEFNIDKIAKRYLELPNLDH